MCCCLLLVLLTAAGVLHTHRTQLQLAVVSEMTGVILGLNLLGEGGAGACGCTDAGGI